MALDSKPAHEITSSEILELINSVEQRRRVVWSVGRILIEDGTYKRLTSQAREIRKPYLKPLRKILEEMADEGILANRGTQFNYGPGKEAAYDYNGLPPILPTQ